VECSKKYICGHNRTGDASPALDVHHMPTNVDKVGAMFRVVSAAARMISTRRLLVANERLERSASIPSYDTFIHLFSDDDIEQLYVHLEALHTSIMAAKTARDSTIKDTAKVQAILDQRAVDMCKTINVRLRSVVFNPAFKGSSSNHPNDSTLFSRYEDLRSGLEPLVEKARDY